MTREKDSLFSKASIVDDWRKDSEKLKNGFENLFLEEILPKLPENMNEELAVDSISFNKNYPAFHILKENARLLGDETHKNLHFNVDFGAEKAKVGISFYSNDLVEKFDRVDKDELYNILSDYHLKFRWGSRPAGHHFRNILGEEWTDDIPKEDFEKAIEKLVSLRKKAKKENKDHPACLIEKIYSEKIKQNKDIFCEKIVEGLKLLNPVYDYMNESLCSGEVKTLESRLEKKIMKLESRKKEKDKKKDEIRRLEQLGDLSDRLELDEEDREAKLDKFKQEVSAIEEEINTLEGEIESIRSRLEN